MPTEKVYRTVVVTPRPQEEEKSDMSPKDEVEMGAVNSQDEKKAAHGDDITELSTIISVRRQSTMHTDLEAVTFENKFMKKIIDHPKGSFFTFCGGICFFFLLVIVLSLVGVTVVPFSTDVPLYLRNHKTYERADALIEGEDTANYAFEDPTTQLSQVNEHVTFELIWVSDSASKDLYTAERMSFMHSREQQVATRSSKFNDYCKLVDSAYSSSRLCQRRASVINFMNSSFVDPNNVSLSLYFDPGVEVNPDLSQTTIDGILNAWSNFDPDEAEPIIGTRFAPIWGVTDDQFGSETNYTFGRACRVEFSFGLPIAGYSSDVDRPDDQKEEITQWLFDTFDSWGEDNSGKGMTLYWGDSEGDMSSLKIQDYLTTTMILIVGSLVFVWLYMSLMNSSFLIGTLGIFMILFAMFPSLLLYRYVFQMNYFGTFNILSIFIILGIGADDLFVFLDHFSLSGSHEMPVSVHGSFWSRLSWTYSKSGKAMALTSATTIFAFLANSTSQFPAIYTFGIFSALLVLVNYISVITYFPSVVVLYENFFANDKLCSVNRCCGYGASSNTTAVVAGGAATAGAATAASGKSNQSAKGPTAHHSRAARASSDDDVPDSVAEKDSAAIPVVSDTKGGDVKKAHGDEEVEAVEHGPVQRFFRDVWGPKFVQHPVFRFVALGIGLAVFIVFALFAAQLEPDPNVPQIHQDGTNYAEFNGIKARYFAGRQESPENTQIDLVFGITGIDRSGTNPADSDDRGKVIFSKDFGIFTTESQIFLADLCDDIVSDTVRAKLQISDPAEKKVIDCFMTDFRDWYDNEDISLTKKSDPNLKFPVTASHCGAATEYNCTTEAYRAFFDDQTKRADGLQQVTNYERHINNFLHFENTGNIGNDVGLRFNRIHILTDMRHTSMKFEDGIDLYKTWEEYMESKLTEAPPGLRSGFQTARGVWHYYFLQEQLVSEAYTGIFLSLLFAFIVLTIATKNIIISTVATMTITMIVISVMGYAVMNGWKLGILESINFILVPGLAVDYSVHLVDAYLESHKKTRDEKVNDMLVEVGVSVISGALSTLGASFFMFFSPISFFFKFASFIFATILLSCFFSLVFLASLLAIIGPIGDTGSIAKYTRRVTAWIHSLTADSAAKVEAEKEASRLSHNPVSQVVHYA